MKTLLLASACILSIVTGTQAQVPMVDCQLGYRSYFVNSNVCNVLNRLYFKVTENIIRGDRSSLSKDITDCMKDFNQSFDVHNDHGFCNTAYTDMAMHNAMNHTSR